MQAQHLARRLLPWAGPLAAVSFGGALIGFGAALGGFSHARHPAALLGADGIAHSLAFNLMGFVLPGLLAAWVAVDLRQQVASARWQWRIGAQLLMLSALAFAAQGLLPMDMQRLDGPQSSYHTLAWTLWWMAFVPGGALLAYASNGQPGRVGMVRLTWLATAIVLLAVLFPAGHVPPGAMQRLAFAAWLLWLAVVSWWRPR